jgi:hypothetical protein
MCTRVQKDKRTRHTASQGAAAEVSSVSGTRRVEGRGLRYTTVGFALCISGRLGLQVTGGLATQPRWQLGGGICGLARADSDAPAGLTSSHRETPSSTWLRAREGPGVRLLFDLLSSCSGLLKPAAVTTPAAVTVPTSTLNLLQSALHSRG